MIIKKIFNKVYNYNLKYLIKYNPNSRFLSNDIWVSTNV